jgi:hypothetical protein
VISRIHPNTSACGASPNDQRVVAANDVRELRSTIEKQKRGKSGGRGNKKNLSAETSDKFSKPKTDTRKEVAQEYQVPEKKLRHAQRIKKAVFRSASNSRSRSAS